MPNNGVINYAEKYAGKIAECFTRDSFIKNNTLGTLDFSGGKTVRVTMLNTVPEVDYSRSGLSRYGTPTDVTDTIHEYTMTQDKAFNGIVDKGDASDQAISGKAGAWLRAQMREQCTPAADRYAFSQIAKFGHCGTVAAALDKTNVLDAVASSGAYMDEHLVPDDGRILYTPPDVYNAILLSDEFIRLDTLGSKSVSRGESGTLFGMKVIKVPSSILPKQVKFIAQLKSAVTMPYKLSETKVHTDPPGISGALIEGRHYYDCFVLGNKADGVYVCTEAANKQANVSATTASGKVTLASAGAFAIHYTVDGGDPRFAREDDGRNHGRRVYTAAFDAPPGTLVRAVAYGAEGKFTSDVLTYKTA